MPKRVTVTARERNRLVASGRPLGAAIRDLVTVVSPRTFARWVAGRGWPDALPGGNPTPGRPRTPANARALVVRLAGETGRGYLRIHGELGKLGVRGVSRSTGVNILREAGIDPAPSAAGAPGPRSSAGTRPPCGPPTS